MPLNAEAIQPGKCYATAGKDRYKVLHINRGIVTFVIWTGAQKPSPLRNNAGVKAFAEAVTKEIACPAEE